MSEIDQVRRRVAGVTPGGGYSILVAEIDASTSPASIRYYTTPIIAWATVYYEHPNGDPTMDLSAEPIVLDPDSIMAMELSHAVNGIGETAAYRIIPPDATGLSKDDLQDLEEELFQGYAVYLKSERKLRKARETKEREMKASKEKLKALMDAAKSPVVSTVN